MNAALHPQTKVTTGRLVVGLLVLALASNGWVISTTLPRVTALLVAAVGLFAVSISFLVNDVIA